MEAEVAKVRNLKKGMMEEEEEEEAEEEAEVEEGKGESERLFDWCPSTPW